MELVTVTQNFYINNMTLTFIVTNIVVALFLFAIKLNLPLI